MKFPELCERLVQLEGAANVLCSEYPELGAKDESQAEWIIWVQDGVYDVGGMDRGEWASTRVFSTEEDACSYVHDLMTREPRLHVPTPEEQLRSKLANEKMMRFLRGDRGAESS